MATARQRAGVQGVDKFRRKLRRLPKEYTEGIKVSVEEGLQAIRADAIRHVPRDEGDLARSINYKLSNDKFAGVVGPGATAAEIVRRKTGTRFGGASLNVNMTAKNRHLYWQFIKGYWIEHGTKGHPPKNIPRMNARPFMGPAFWLNRSWFVRRTQKAIEMAIRRAFRATR